MAEASYVHWQGVLVFLPGPDNRTAIVVGPGPPGSRAATLVVQPGVYEERWVAEAASGGDQIVEATSLRLVPPSRKDRVKIVGEVGDVGASSQAPGAVGSLIGMDGPDGIVKVGEGPFLVGESSSPGRPTDVPLLFIPLSSARMICHAPGF